jgi:hypothetical protein
VCSNHLNFGPNSQKIFIMSLLLKIEHRRRMHEL